MGPVVSNSHLGTIGASLSRVGRFDPAALDVATRIQTGTAGPDDLLKAAQIFKSLKSRPDLPGHFVNQIGTGLAALEELEHTTRTQKAPAAQLQGSPGAVSQMGSNRGPTRRVIRPTDLNPQNSPANKEAPAPESAASKTARLRARARRELLEQVQTESTEELELRDYQKEWIKSFLHSVASGEDRATLRAPYQTGKSQILPELAKLAGDLFPEKMTVFVHPYRTVGRNARADLQKYFHGKKIAFWDGTEKPKDLEGVDVLVITRQSLDTERAQGLMNTREVGLVILDELSAFMKSQGVKVLSSLGFLKIQDKKIQIQEAPGKYLLGLTSDSGNFERVFGANSRLDTKGIVWYINNNILHRPVGRKILYDQDMLMEVVRDQGEKFYVPKDNDAYAAFVVNVYDENYRGKKTIVNTPRILSALKIEAAFKQKYGEGYARAIHSKMRESEVAQIERDYREGKIKVIIQINKISYGFRAHGTEVVMNTAVTESRNRYGQRIGRALGKNMQDPQRDIEVVDFFAATHIISNFASLPTLFGMAGYDDHGLFVPDEKQVLKRIKQKRVGIDLNGVSSFNGSSFKYTSQNTGSKIAYANAFPTLLHKVLQDQFDGNVFAMADFMGVETGALTSWLVGELPRDYSDVFKIQTKLGFENNELVYAWEDDVLSLLNQMFASDENLTEEQNILVKMFRTVVLYRGGQIVRTLQMHLIEKGGFLNNPKIHREYGDSHKIFHGRLSQVKNRSLKLVAQIIDEALQNFPHIRRTPELEEILNSFLWIDDKDLEDRASFVPIEEVADDMAASADELVMHDAWENLVEDRNPTKGLYEHGRSQKLFRAWWDVLSERNRYVLSRLYGLDSDYDKKRLVAAEDSEFRTLSEVGKEMSLSRERVRQYEREALFRLRDRGGMDSGFDTHYEIYEPKPVPTHPPYYYEVASAAIEFLSLQHWLYRSFQFSGDLDGFVKAFDTSFSRSDYFFNVMMFTSEAEVESLTYFLKKILNVSPRDNGDKFLEGFSPRTAKRKLKFLQMERAFHFSKMQRYDEWKPEYSKIFITPADDLIVKILDELKKFVEE